MQTLWSLLQIETVYLFRAEERLADEGYGAGAFDAKEELHDARGGLQHLHAPLLRVRPSHARIATLTLQPADIEN
eukprot:2110359-Rhodomonas_salina.4